MASVLTVLAASASFMAPLASRRAVARCDICAVAIPPEKFAQPKKIEADSIANKPTASTWQQTAKSGWKFVDEVEGDGVVPSATTVVRVTHTCSIADSGKVLRKSEHEILTIGDDRQPLWSEALEGMRIGGRRRLIVTPAEAEDQAPTLRFDIELEKIETGVAARVAAKMPSRMTIAGTLYALSFVPYFMPYEMQPSIYHDGKPIPTAEERAALREQEVNSRFLGGNVDVDALFPSDGL